MADFVEVISKAELIICHSGAGTLIHILRAGKHPVVMPRRRKYGEVVDDHQVELATAFAAEGRVTHAAEPGDLPGAIESACRAAANTPGDASDGCSGLATVKQALDAALKANP
jgi:UDP-N-acetylglucosamine transferase subunit ALG13